MRFINSLALILVVIGAINWGLIGFFNINIVSMLFSTGLARIIYGIVGLAGLWSLTFFRYFVDPRCNR